LIFNSAEMTDEGEIKCESGKMSSVCQMTVKKGESKPIIKSAGDVEGPCTKPIYFEVPYTGMGEICCPPRGGAGIRVTPNILLFS